MRGEIDCSISAFRISALNKTCSGNRGKPVSEALRELVAYFIFFILNFKVFVAWCAHAASTMTEWTHNCFFPLKIGALTLKSIFVLKVGYSSI